MRQKMLAQRRLRLATYTTLSWAGTSRKLTAWAGIQNIRLDWNVVTNFSLKTSTLTSSCRLSPHLTWAPWWCPLFLPRGSSGCRRWHRRADSWRTGPALSSWWWWQWPGPQTWRPARDTSSRGARGAPVCQESSIFKIENSSIISFYLPSTS